MLRDNELPNGESVPTRDALAIDVSRFCLIHLKNFTNEEWYEIALERLESGRHPGNRYYVSCKGVPLAYRRDSEMLDIHLKEEGSYIVDVDPRKYVFFVLV